jgi:hypothetical protein
MVTVMRQDLLWDHITTQKFLRGDEAISFVGQLGSGTPRRIAHGWEVPWNLVRAMWWARAYSPGIAGKLRFPDLVRDENRTRRRGLKL